MVGAGGIGCELLKNLVLMKFAEIHVVDLDTIDLSNLNRQFLFRPEHIKQPKAHVAKDAALKFNPNAKIESYHANIKDSQFSRTWFKSFDIVFNALDNIDARKYVNKMCIALDIPLVESGTTGFHGQAFIIKRGVTACYECEPKEPPKTFPVCTIRNTPSQPIHCVVWAKSYLFTEMFGGGAEAASELNFAATGDNVEEMKKLRQEMLALQTIRDSIGSEKFPRLVFDKVFSDDIKTSLTMDDMWVGKRAPVPMQYDEYFEAQKPNDTANSEQITWTKQQCVEVFYESIQRLSRRVLAAKDSDSESTAIDFDKDDPDTLDFVAAAANLRCYVFGIEPKSKFAIKQMAGNIIPAIATTNAIIAGACVLQAMKVLQGEYAKPGCLVTSKTSYRVMNAFERPPNPTCPVCSSVRTDVLVRSSATLGMLVDGLKSKHDYKNFKIFTDAGLVFEEEEEEEEFSDDEDDMLSKKLEDLQITPGVSLRIVQEPRVELVLEVQEASSTGPEIMLVDVEIPTRAATNGVAQPPVIPITNGVSIANSVTLVPVIGKKRPAEDALESEQKTKLKQSNEGVVDGIIIID